jgi:hypothetical protein
MGRWGWNTLAAMRLQYLPQSRTGFNSATDDGKPSQIIDGGSRGKEAHRQVYSGVVAQEPYLVTEPV